MIACIFGTWQPAGILGYWFKGYRIGRQTLLLNILLGRCTVPMIAEHLVADSRPLIDLDLVAFCNFGYRINQGLDLPLVV